MSIGHPIEGIQEKHLLQLRDEKAYEHQTLEFKTDADFTEKALTEFLRDVSAMANAEGGDMIIGIAEDSEGRAKEVRKTQHADLENLESRIRNHCANHIDPPLVSIRFHPVHLAPADTRSFCGSIKGGQVRTWLHTEATTGFL